MQHADGGFGLSFAGRNLCGDEARGLRWITLRASKGHAAQQAISFIAGRLFQRVGGSRGVISFRPLLHEVLPCIAATCAELFGQCDRARGIRFRDLRANDFRDGIALCSFRRARRPRQRRRRIRPRPRASVVWIFWNGWCRDRFGFCS